MLNTENIQTTVSALNRDFAGRMHSPSYDASKTIHIHRRNRAFVWKLEDQKRCLDSILKGYYIPPIICSSAIVNGREQRQVMEGGNRITTFRNILNGEVAELTPEQRSIVESHPITLVVIRGMTPKQQREMFRRLNKNVKVSDGQLFAMSEDDSPLIREAMALLYEDTYPLRQTITELFFDTRSADNDGKTNLSNAVALVSGALHGPDYISKSFNVQELMVEDQTPVDRQAVAGLLGKVFDTFRMADRTSLLEDRRKKRGQWTVGRLPGVILYDLLMNPEGHAAVQEKWCNFIIRTRRNEAGATQMLSWRIWGANMTADRHRRISAMVDVYLRDNRLVTDEELKQFKHPRPAANGEADTNSFTDEEDELDEAAYGEV